MFLYSPIRNGFMQAEGQIYQVQLMAPRRRLSKAHDVENGFAICADSMDSYLYLYIYIPYGTFYA